MFLLCRSRAGQASREVNRLGEPALALLRDGNSNNNRTDPCQSAKRQFLIGLLVQKRDRLDEKHAAWEAFAERLGTIVTTLRNWKGKKLPYPLGVVDV